MSSQASAGHGRESDGDGNVCLGDTLSPFLSLSKEQVENITGS